MKTSAWLTSTLACSCLATIVTADTLDDYSSDTNFVNGLYTFVAVNGNPANDPQVAGGELRVNTAGSGTAAFLWNQGQALRNVGDMATVDIRLDVSGNEFASAGLYLTDTLGPGGQNRLISLFVDSSFTVFSVGFDDYFLDGNPLATSTLTVEVTAVFQNSLQLETKLSGGVSSPAVSFSLPVQELSFGPSAGFSDGTMTFHDNLDFIAGQVACLGNLNGDGIVGTLDLLALLGAWGPCIGCPADLDNDGQVGTLDLLGLLGAWGPCPGAACCLTDHTCVITTESDCVAAGGTYQGDGTICEVQFCGVCCFPGKNKDDCTFGEIYNIPSACDAQGGYFLGECTYCGGFCDFVDWGSCCLMDGSCVETSFFNCKGMNGEFSAGLSCDCAECVPAPTGACVCGEPDFFSCEELTQFDCNIASGVYQGDGTTCPTETGACCFSPGDCFENTNEDACTCNGGVYLGVGSTCADCDATGACCLPDHTCSITTESECSAANGTYQGDDTACEVQFCGTCLLDDYSSDQNFVDGKYSFVSVFNGGGNDPQVSGGELKINSFNGTSTFGTSAFLWNEGPQLQNVGDQVSVEVRFDGGPIAAGSTHIGLWLSDTLDGSGATQEVNMGRLIGDSYVMQVVGITTTPLDGAPIGNATLSVDVVGATDTALDLIVTLAGNGFSSVSQTFTVNATMLSYGPVAFDTDGTNGIHDNLTFTAPPDAP